MQISMNILRNRTDSEECVNDTYLKMWNRIPPERPIYLLPYAGAIVRNVSLDRYKYNTAEKRNFNTTATLSEIDECIPEKTSVTDAIENDSITEAINLFLDGLDPVSKILFVRRYWYFDSYDSLAKRYGMSAGSIRTKLSRIRKKLYIFLEKRGISV